MFLCIKYGILTILLWNFVYGTISIKFNHKMIDTKIHRPSKRTLIYIPIIHTETDMGSLSESVKQATLSKFGKNGWKQKVELVDKVWTYIELAIADLNLPFERIRIYQDALPICGKEIEIVTDLAKGGSRNHQILLHLIEKGAMIMGTESLELLMKEYELTKQNLAMIENSKSNEELVYLKTLSESILRKRDEFIANRIHLTLRNGEFGTLFIGMLHTVLNFLPDDIQIIHPINKSSINCGRNNEEEQKSGADS